MPSLLHLCSFAQWAHNKTQWAIIMIYSFPNKTSHKQRNHAINGQWQIARRKKYLGQWSRIYSALNFNSGTVKDNVDSAIENTIGLQAESGNGIGAQLLGLFFGFSDQFITCRTGQLTHAFQFASNDALETGSDFSHNVATFYLRENDYYYIVQLVLLAFFGH